MRLRACGLFLALLLSSACSTLQRPAARNPAPEPSAGQLDAITVHHIKSGRLQGSAVAVADDRLVTSRHLLTRRLVQVDGVPTRYSIVASGPDDKTYADDWAVIELLDLSIPAPPTLPDQDPDAHVEVGQDIYLIGYWRRGTLPRAGISEQTKTVVRARVVSPPPSWMGPRTGLIFLDAPHGETYAGLSGGAAAYYDSVADRLMVIGIYQGTIEGKVLGWKWKGHVVRTFPFP